jgi:hypothetical protein
VLQCVAVCCSVMQCVAVCCNGKGYLATLRKNKWSLSFSVASASGASGVLQCVTMCCSVCMCVAVCVCVLQCVAWGILPLSEKDKWARGFSTAFFPAACVLQCVAECCRVFRCVAVRGAVCVVMCCSALQCVVIRVFLCSCQCVVVCCGVLHFVSVCCSVLQCVAVLAFRKKEVCCNNVSASSSTTGHVVFCIALCCSVLWSFHKSQLYFRLILKIDRDLIFENLCVFGRTCNTSSPGTNFEIAARGVFLCVQERGGGVFRLL